VHKPIDQPNENDRGGNFVVGLVTAIVVVFLIGMGGFEGIGRFIERHTSHEKLATVRYRGEWILGEYRECESVNLKTEDKQPELDCAGVVVPNTGKVFNVSFSGDLTYDSERAESVAHRWLCRRNDGDPSFSCSARETPEQKQAEEKQAPGQQQATPQAAQQPAQQPVINDEGLPESIRSCIARFQNPYSGADYKTYHDDLKADCERDTQRTTP